jgi:hypothetical protein
MQGQQFSTLKLLMQGIHLKQDKKAEEDVKPATAQNYLINEQHFHISAEDKEIFENSLKFVNTYDSLEDNGILVDKSPEELKAIHRRREMVIEI